MKPITIRNQQYYYKIIENKGLFRKKYFTDKTYFYETESSKKFLFETNVNVEDPHYTKGEMRLFLEDKVKKYLEFKERKLEIERGEII